jgi:hypothetical protein
MGVRLSELTGEAVKQTCSVISKKNQYSIRRLTASKINMEELSYKRWGHERRETRDQRRERLLKQRGPVSRYNLFTGLFIYKTIKVQNTQAYLFGCGVYLR